MVSADRFIHFYSILYTEVISVLVSHHRQSTLDLSLRPNLYLSKADVAIPANMVQTSIFVAKTRRGSLSLSCIKSANAIRSCKPSHMVHSSADPSRVRTWYPDVIGGRVLIARQDEPR